MNRIVKVVVLVAVAGGIGFPTAASTFLSSERDVVIGAHQAVVSPDLSGSAELDFGPLLPRLRLPAEAPAGIGVRIRLGDADVSNLEQLVARDAIIASQPQGEIAEVRSAIASMAVDAGLRGLGAGALGALIVIVGWKAVGVQRRREIRSAWRRPTRRRALGAAAVAGVAVVSVALVAVPDRPRDDLTTWVPVRTVFPELPADPVLDTLEVAQGASTSGGRALVEGALSTYQDSVEFYGKLAESAASIEVRQPQDGESTALVVTDRHDNIGMDPVARAVADRAGARLLIDLGDDTSTGAAWESFSINSLAREFRGFDVVAVAGNHDNGTNVVDQMADKGFTVLAGEPETVAGIRFVGGSDPRSSGLTAGYTGEEPDNIAAIREQDEALTQAACADGDATVAAVHSSASARRLGRSGCVDLVLSGHLHRQVGPAQVESDGVDGEAGRSTTRLATGSTGGAVYAFALGSKLRREAQVTIVTFSDGRPVGLQPVSFQPGGIIDVADYVPLPAPAG